MRLLLDSYLAALVAAGSPIERHLMDPPSEDYVRSQLVASGRIDQDELVGFFTWRSFEPDVWLGGNADYSFFWEYAAVLPVEVAIEMQDGNTKVRGEPLSREQWPGEKKWLPIAALDLAEFMAVDATNGPDAGAVWHLFTQSENVRMFGSLAEAIRTAQYCVETELWRIEDESIRCDRRSQPSAKDLESPPWKR